MSIAQHLIAELQAGRIQSVAFVVPCDVRWTLPLYEEAITTARRGWQLGIPAATYWFVTPEPEPRADLEAEGITFIGSTYADVRAGMVMLDPQDERIEPDRIVVAGRVHVEKTLLARPNLNSLARHGHQWASVGAARATQ